MKTFIAVLLLVSSFSAFSANVISANLDAAKKNLLIDVAYSGGCKEHSFSLKLSGCADTVPAQCFSDVVETIQDGFDSCEGLMTTTFVVNLKEAGLKDKFYKKAYLIIRSNRSHTAIRLP